jgi:hypothetical protein
MLYGSLPYLVYEQMREAGFDFGAARATDTRPCLWVRPPLLTELELGGKRLQPHLSVQLRRSPEDLVDIYERFVGGFIYTRAETKPFESPLVATPHIRGAGRPRSISSDRWFQRELVVKYHIARSLFVKPAPGALRLGLHMHLVQFAALVAYNHRCHLEHGESTFVAITVQEALQFGVRDGRLVSNLTSVRREIPVRGLANPQGRLVDLPRGEPELNDEPNLYDTARCWLEANRRRLGKTGQALELAVNILRWHSPRAVPGMLRLLVSFERSRKALTETCAEARGYERFDDPMTTLRTMFVPHFVTSSEFARLFGNPYYQVALPLSERVRQRWDQALNELDPHYNEPEDNNKNDHGQTNCGQPVA